MIESTIIQAGATLKAEQAQREAYLDFLRLSRNPFPVSPDAENFFLPQRIDTLITEILHCIQTRKGFMILTGEVGLGKTTISRRILRSLEETRVETALVFNTFVQGAELLAEINRDFGLEAPEGSSLSKLMGDLNNFLLEKNLQGINCAILIDDAQNLNLESLELVRMISNFEANAAKLVQILLIGQPELLDKLNMHELRQLKSRIVVHGEVVPYNLDELKQYIHFKLHSVGGSGSVTIPERGFHLMHKLTQGNPRQINNLMDRCLYGLFAYGTNALGPKLIREVAQEVGLRVPQKSWESHWKRHGLALVGLSLGLMAIIFAVHISRGGGGKPDGESRAVLEQARGELEKARQEREKAEKEAVAAKELRQKIQGEVSELRVSRDRANKQLAEVKAAQEESLKEVARARIAEAKALTEAAQSRNSTATEVEAQAVTLAKARANREKAEQEAAQQSRAIQEAEERVRLQGQALDQALAAQAGAEERARRAEGALDLMQRQVKEQALALEEANKAREAAREESQQTRKLLTQVQESAKRQEQETKAQAEALRQAKEAMEKDLAQAKQSLDSLQATREETRKRLESVEKEASERLRKLAQERQEAETALQTARQEAEQSRVNLEAKVTQEQEKAKEVVAQAEAGRKKAEEESRRREEELRRKEQELARLKEEAEKALVQAKTAQDRATKEMEQAGGSVDKKDAAREESLRRVKEEADLQITQARERLDQARKELQAAREESRILVVKEGTARVPDEVVAFMKDYGVESLAPALHLALQTGWLEGVARQIGAASALRLVVLAHPSAEVSREYRTLPWKVPGLGMRHLLLWKAPFWVETFHFAASGPEIGLLQSQLKQLGYYDQEVDNIVGRGTMRAVRAFQQKSGLEPTGVADAATQFFLSRLAAKAPHAAGKGGGKSTSDKASPVQELREENPWTVQVGSFAQEQDARPLLRRLKEGGYASFMQTVLAQLPEQPPWVAVRVGTYRTREEAEEIARNLQAQFALDGIVLQIWPLKEVPQ
ncbi:MAG: AAA family ATPase [Magnetococcales bacterium]|nr:AAA family ATPase [Magnetococcales bacterium]